VTNLPVEIQRLIATPEPPALGPGPRGGVKTSADLKSALNRAGLPSSRAELIHATILLWHDYLDAAHEIVQEVESSDGSYIHAILHRREPDYGNAKYWFRRVGQHQCFPALAARVSTMLKADADASLASKLVPRGQWDPIQFVDLCKAATRANSDPSRAVLLRQIQQIEFEVLLAQLCRDD